MAPGAADAQMVPTDPGDFDQLTQCLIQAPSNRPYFLLLQGYQDAQVSTISPTSEETTTPRMPWAEALSCIMAVPQGSQIGSSMVGAEVEGRCKDPI